MSSSFYEMDMLGDPGSSSNDPLGTPQVRAPRGALKINGVLAPFWDQLEVENNNYASADTFSATFLVSALPPDRDVTWFSQQQDMYCELFMGIPTDPNNYGPDDLTSYIYGQADSIEYDPTRGQIRVMGRDLTRVFIDAKTSEKFQQKTSSQIAQLLAQRRGLQAVVTPTTTPAGKYYDIDHVNFMDERSEWDILNYLAQFEGFVVYVRGQTLYFQPPPDPSTALSYPLVWTPPGPTGGYASGNVVSMQLSRALTVSRGVTVVVRSWNDKHAHGFNAVYPRKNVTSIAPGQSTTPHAQGQVFYVRRGNLTQQQAEQLAQSTYKQIIAHEMRLQADLPGDDMLDTSTIIQLSGTQTAFDQAYYPDSIRRTLSQRAGYQMVVHAKNHNPASMAAAL